MTALKLVRGMVWPADDTECEAVVFDQVTDLERIYPHVTDWSACVQAGGNCGVFAMALAPKFGAVYTFEPDPENFTCLAHNVHDHENVYRIQAALGQPGSLPIDLDRVPGNCGAHQVGTAGRIPVLTIDALNLPACGLVLLDVEGSEYAAVLGAYRTLERCRPVVALEMKGIGNRYGVPDAELDAWLTGPGHYRLADQYNAGRDRLYVPA